MNKTTKNIKSQSKNEYESTIAKNYKIDYKHFLKLPNKKEVISSINNINYKIEEDKISIVYVNKTTIEDVKKFIVFDYSKLSNNQLKELIVKSFISASKLQLNTIEKQKDFNTLTYNATLKAYQFYKTLNLQVYFNDKIVEYNKLTKQYQSKNI